MKVALVVVAAVAVLILLAGVFAYRRLKRLAASRQTATLVESFDAGLAIPMRDSDTRRPPRR